jgi:hypothetical protein
MYRVRFLAFLLEYNLPELRYAQAGKREKAIERHRTKKTPPHRGRVCTPARPDPNFSRYCIAGFRIKASWRENMKNLMLVLMLVATFSASAFSDEIPSGITYVKAPDEINMKAQKKLEELFAKTPVRLDDLFDSNVTCGPFLWAQIKDTETLRNLKILKAQIVIPLRDGGRQTLEGAVFRTEEQRFALCRAIEDYLGSGNPYQIRRPNAEELSIYWAMIPFDITEPIFVAENSEHKLLMHFMNDRTVFWVSDLQGVSFSRQAP